MKLLRFPLLFLAVLFSSLAAHAQISVQLSLKEHFYILHEPIVATVTVTNNTGRDITFSDTKQFQWFAFRIKSMDDRVIGPRGKYNLQPLTVHAGEMQKRSVNLNELYEMGDFGIYAIRAEIYAETADKFFSSGPATIELTEGRLIWKRVAGVPEGQPHAGMMHVFTVLAHQRRENNEIYVRVEDEEFGTVFCTYSLGRIMEGMAPEMQFDSSNNLYVLQLVGDKMYALSKIGPNGQFLGQTNYSAAKSRPSFRKLENGSLQLIGGRREDRFEKGPATAPSKLSDRPPGLPMGPAGPAGN